MDRIDSLLQRLIIEAESVGLYRDPGAIRRASERREALRQQIATEYRAMYEACEAIIHAEEAATDEANFEYLVEATDLARAARAAARGEGSDG